MVEKTKDNKIHYYIFLMICRKIGIACVIRTLVTTPCDYAFGLAGYNYLGMHPSQGYRDIIPAVS